MARQSRAQQLLQEARDLRGSGQTEEQILNLDDIIARAKERREKQ